MEYFTRAWALGELSETAEAEIEARYRASLERLEPESAVNRFVRGVSLNDAHVDRLTQTGDALSLHLRTGDQQRGYWRTCLRYLGGRVVFGDAALQRALADRPTEIWYDEFAAPPRKVHRFLLVRPGSSEDRGEVHIAFDDFAFSEAPAPSRDLDD